MTALQDDHTTTRVLFTVAEADPLIKVGGLGDVGGSLPRALQSLNPDQIKGTHLDVRLVIPLHSGIDRSAFQLKPLGTFPVPHLPEPIQADVFETHINGLAVYLIAGEPIPQEGPVYSLDTRADGVKFAFFSLAALELARYLDWQPHILHANDWHTALAVYALYLLRPEDTFFESVSSVLTLHNLPFMGAGTEFALSEFGLPPASDPRLPEWARRLPLPLGLLAADRIVAVSPGYAREVLTPQFGCGLEDFLKTRRSSLSGILNGIDQTVWDPATDPLIPMRFHTDQLEQRLENKKALLAEVGLAGDPDMPLLALISRMDPQKGIDIALEGLRQSASLPWQAVLMGTGIPDLEDETRRLEAEYPDRIRAVIRFDSSLSHRVYAGSDSLLMPSRYEPCGLAQMIAMRFGSVPLARATGGLSDTILDKSGHAGNTGFLFNEAHPDAFSTALHRAITIWDDKAAWQRYQVNGMAQDFSWEHSAIAYAQIYANLRSKNR